MRCIEDICVFYEKAPQYNPQGLKKLEKPIKRQKQDNGKDYIYKMNTLSKPFEQKFTNYPVHMLEFKIPAGKERLHPTQKPVDLLEYLIKTYTEPG